MTLGYSMHIVDMKSERWERALYIEKTENLQECLDYRR